MDIKPVGDLIVDEYGNYYIATILQTGGGSNEITLENAFMHYSFNRLIHEELLADYKHNFLGKLPTEILKSSIELLKQVKVH